jgi:hypothetical protein
VAARPVDGRYTAQRVGTKTVPMEPTPEYDQERLDLLQGIRARFLEQAAAGDDGAMRIVRAVEGMIAEVEAWLRLR